MRVNKQVMSYRRFEKKNPTCALFKDHLKMGDTGCAETSVTTNRCRVTFQRSENVICVATECCKQVLL